MLIIKFEPMDLEDKKWFVLRTKSRAEKLVSARLDAIGVVNYLPLYHVVKQWKDRKKRVEDVLIKGYVFVHVCYKERTVVYDIVGVSNYLFVNGKIAEIKAKEIENLKIFCKFDDIIIDSLTPRKGVEVEIIAGELCGFKGFIREDAKGKFVCLHIGELGFFASIRICKLDVRLLKSVG